MLRSKLDMYANVSYVKSIEGIKAKYVNLDLIIIREQAEGEFKAMEHEPVQGLVEALKITTKVNSERIHKVIQNFKICLIKFWKSKKHI